MFPEPILHEVTDDLPLQISGENFSMKSELLSCFSHQWKDPHQLTSSDPPGRHPSQ